MKLSFIFALTAALVGCASHKGSSDPTPTQDNTPASGVNAPGDNTPAPVPIPTDTSSPTPPAPAPETLDTCISTCETQYPKAAQESKQFDTTCMLGVCSTSCNGIGASGKDFTPNVDGGAVCDTSMSWAISLPSQDCANCIATTATCCSQWVAIFGSADGQALSTCSNTCYTKFPQK